MSDGTKKVEEAPSILSMREYPALYNRFSPLSTDNPRTHNDEGMQKDNIDDGESGLSKQAEAYYRSAWRFDNKEHKRL